MPSVQHHDSHDPPGQAHHDNDPHPHDPHHGQEPNHGHDHHGHDRGHGGWWHRLRHVVQPHSHDTADQVDSALEGSREGMRAVWISLG
ncbi:MAG TPA: cation transporter, partial [Micromonosporaceae bacterium]